MPECCYLIHFSTPYKHARHYFGYTKGTAQKRFERHCAGNGANLIRVVIAAGIEVKLVRVWEGKGRDFERLVKKRGGHRSRLCPICVQEKTNDKNSNDTNNGRA